MRCTHTKQSVNASNSVQFTYILWHSPPLVLPAEPRWSLASWPPGIGAAAHCLRVQESA